MPNASASKPRAGTSSRLGFTEKTHDELFRAAHDIKGEAATFGYPGGRRPPPRACAGCSNTRPNMTRIPLALVEQHVDAVRAIVREYARPDLAKHRRRR